MLHKIRSLYLQLRTIRQINNQLADRIEDAGISDNVPFIRLSGGMVFYGQTSPYYLKRLYFMLRRSIRRMVSPAQMQVLFDISFRYLGRKNQRLNLKEGKYMDFEEGSIIFEVGAYIGYHAMRLGELTGEKGLVVAIEAIPSNYELLRKNIEANRIKNIIPVHLAVWKESGILSFDMDEAQKNSAVNNVVRSRKTMEVPCDTIDHIFQARGLSRIDFIRIQTNGAELEALQGMKEVLKQKPMLLVAVPYRNRQQVSQMVADHGYTTSFTGHSIFAIPE